MIYTIPTQRLCRGGKRFTNARQANRIVNWQGLPLKIEIEIGEAKSGVDEAGNNWAHVYKVPYGEIPSSRALSDGDGVDIYLGPDVQASLVYIVHQLKMNGAYDEDKCMLGFSSIGDAILAYKQHGPVWGFGTVDTLTVDQFLRGYLASNRKL